jgi:predicted XRE-type DNA-binding protein
MRSGRSAKTTKRGTDTGVEASSGNVFADLGIPNPELALAKAELVQLIRRIITKRKMTQASAARLLGIDQPKVSALVRGKVEGYSLDRLFRFLTALDRHIEISVRSPRKTKTHADRAITATS